MISPTYGTIPDRCDYPLDGMGAASYHKRRAAGLPGAPQRCNRPAVWIVNGYRACNLHWESGMERIDE
jgi:hypothetical protein